MNLKAIEGCETIDHRLSSQINLNPRKVEKLTRVVNANCAGYLRRDVDDDNDHDLRLARHRTVHPQKFLGRCREGERSDGAHRARMSVRRRSDRLHHRNCHPGRPAILSWRVNCQLITVLFLFPCCIDLSKIN